MTALKRRPARPITSENSQGFTLTELLIAALLTGVVVTVGGWAMANVIAQNKTSTSRSERRTELSRALDFMSAEVREASTINKEPLPSDFKPAAADVDQGSIQPVLTLAVGLSKPVVYYIASPASGNVTWRGPKVAYRWGPVFDKTGRYGSDQSTPAKWTHQPLIDALEDTSSNPNCPSGWTLSPTGGATGFYACVETQTHRIAQLFQKGQVSKVLGKTEPYLLQTQVLARSSTLAFSISDGRITSTENNSNSTIQVLGSDIRCATTGTPMNTRVQIRVTAPGSAPTTTGVVVNPSSLPAPINLSRQPLGTTYEFIGSVPPASDSNPNNTCNAESVSGSGFSSLTNSRQVQVLKHGDQVPSVGAFGNGQSVKSYLTNYIDGTGKVQLPNPETQSIVLFELGATDTSTSAFDLQDLVLLVTVTPS